MSYAVKEMFLTLQGEGLQAGMRAVFLRFAGCNLWSGREQDRADAQCSFCDTDFVGMDGDGGGRFADAAAVTEAAWTLWSGGLEGSGGGTPLIVITGGEPMLQLDDALVAALKGRSFRVAIETNGTLPVADGVDWICVSPKAGTEIVQRSGDELKLVWPQQGLDPRELESWDFRHLLVQPMDGVDAAAARGAAIDFVIANPRWRLSVQTHKLLGLR
ncbi:7-carboxy-7-deazaguanine synthase [Sphingomonas crusticola]|uniref:7-carboxy-7-deazaguanine synthase n=1 Tax=Sphingomonas crusticola TaxID=1697973 RepID=UPI000E242878|nr:7-carboxy-7-deazaguanine synthase [Sphingomonas crusticola]